MATKKEKEEAAAAAAAAEEKKDPQGGDPANDLPADPSDAKEPAVVELKDKDTGFYDPVTGFQVVRDQQVQLGSTVGDATRLALESKRLLIVSDLPEDFPGRHLFVDAGISSLDELKSLSEEQVRAIKGVSDETLEEILAWGQARSGLTGKK